MLTKAQHNVFEFIKKFIQENNFSPTSAEIAEAIGIKSRGVVYRYLKALAENNLIELTPNRHRNIKLAAQSLKDSIVAKLQIPLLGYIAAGQPIEAVEQNEYIEVNDIFSGSHHYALKVKGDSMQEEGILDGDVVICQHASAAYNGQIVVALVDNQEATLKRLRYDEGKRHVSLIPANQAYETMIYEADRVKIQGIYVGLLRVAA